MAKFWKNIIRIGNPVVNLVSSIAGLFKKDSLVGRVFRSGDSIVNSVLDAASGDSVGNWIKGVSGSGLTNAEIQQNEWNAGQAQEQRSWEEQMDNTKYQRQVADMAAAGLNPAMMMGQGYSASSPSGAAASGSLAGSPSAGLLDSVLSVIFAKQRMSNLRAEGDVLRSQANKNDADAELARSNRALADSRTRYTDIVTQYYPRLTEATVSKIDVEISNLFKDLDVKEHSIYKVDSETALNETRNFVESRQAEWIDRLNVAKEKSDLASAAKDFAESMFKDFSLQFAKEHGGQTPGYNMWSGLASSIAGALTDLGMNEVDLGKLDWVDLCWPWFSFFRKRDK